MMSILHNIIMDLNKVMWRHVAIAIQAFSLDKGRRPSKSISNMKVKA